MAHELAKLKPSDINHMSQPNKSPLQVTALQTAVKESSPCPDLYVQLRLKPWQICWDQNTWHSANVCHYGDWYSPSITLCSCLHFQSFIKLRRLPTVIRHQYEEMAKSTQGQVEVFQLWRAGEVKGGKAEGLLTFLQRLKSWGQGYLYEQGQELTLSPRWAVLIKETGYSTT